MTYNTSSFSQPLAQYGVNGEFPFFKAQDLSTAILGVINRVGGRRKASLLAAISFTGILVARIYWKIIRVPKYLRGLPRVPITFTIKSMFGNTEIIVKARNTYKMACRDAYLRGLTGSLDECPKMWTEWKFGKWQVILANSIDARDFYTNNEIFEKTNPVSLPMYVADRFFGANMIFERTREWKRHRKVISPAFRRGWATSLFFEPTINLLACFDEFAASQKPLDVSIWMKRVAIDVLSSVIMGINFDSINHPDSQMIRAYDGVIACTLDPASNIFGGNLLRYSKGIRQFHQDLDIFNGFVYEWIDKKATKIKNEKGKLDSGNNDSCDLLELMVTAYLANPDSFSREDLRSNCTGFFVAGHETTATALIVAIYFLGMNPSVQEKVRAEVIKIMGDVKVKNVKDMILATNEQQNRMQYLTCVIKESLRLYNGVAGLSREVMDDHEFRSTGLRVPRGTMVSVGTFFIHHNRKYWGSDENQFKPERWLDLNPEAESIPLNASAHDYTWIPFGAGQRVCIGQQFTIVEQRVILSALLLRYSWKIVGDEAALRGEPSTKPNAPLCFENIFVELTKRNL